MSESNGGGKVIPPYITYRGFISFVDSLKRGIPGQIDRSLMKTMSGSMQNQMFAALRYLHTIDAQGNVLEALPRLVNSEGAERAKVLQEMLRSSYPSLFDEFDLSKATANQFRQKFGEMGASGDSIRKCIAFFLSVAKEAEITVSPYITDTIRSQASSTPKKKSAPPPKIGAGFKGNPTQQRETAREPTHLSWEQMLLSKFPSFDPAWPDDVKREWFGSFNQMMKIGKEAGSEQSEEDAAEDDIDEV